MVPEMVALASGVSRTPSPSVSTGVVPCGVVVVSVTVIVGKTLLSLKPICAEL